MKRRTILCLGICFLFSNTLAALEGRAAEPLVVFLVRHAEKADASRDPELSQDGKRRAALLAELLRDSEAKHIHSSDYIRTRNTAAPLAKRLKLPVRTYNPRDLPALVSRLRKTGGRHVVVGHSNTTPQAVKLLGGTPGSRIDEPSEYDRLYIVTVTPDGDVSTVLMRYGKPYRPSQD